MNNGRSPISGPSPVPPVCALPTCFPAGGAHRHADAVAAAVAEARSFRRAAERCLPQLAVPLECRRAGLRVRPFADPAPRRTIALAWRRRFSLASTLRQLAGAVRDAYPAAATTSARLAVGRASEPSKARFGARGRR